MGHINIEIKARCANPDRVRAILRGRKAEHKGIDRQTDTYFKAAHGRLKLRQGDIENGLIYYERADEEGPKRSEVSLYPVENGSGLKEVLTAALGILTVVSKRREIYFIENVKFHIDTVEGLGEFVEIEAIDTRGRMERDVLLRQCREYMKLFGIAETDLVEGSYSDMVARREF
ncbi:MAG: class IV adenylate cyclase [Planctomycetota bacterium]|jgi:predicted adenylyl cyclase CyaB